MDTVSCSEVSFFPSTSVEQSFSSRCCDRRLRRKAVENGAAAVSVTVADAVGIEILSGSLVA